MRLAMFAAAVLASCAAKPEVQRVRGESGVHRFETTVDSPIARCYAERCAAGRREVAAWDATLDAIEAVRSLSA